MIWLKFSPPEHVKDNNQRHKNVAEDGLQDDGSYNITSTPIVKHLVLIIHAKINFKEHLDYACGKSQQKK